MSNKRPLTAEEKAIADRMKAIIAATPGMTEESVGTAVGVSQSQVSHWTGARLPVPAKRAPALAAVLNIEDPGEISVAYRHDALLYKDGTPGASTEAVKPQVSEFKASQAPRFNPLILAATHRALRELYEEELRLEYNIEEEPEQFLLAYELHSALDRKAPGADPIEIFRAAGLARGKGAASDGRVGDGPAGVPNEGTHKGKVAGKVQRKKG